MKGISEEDTKYFKPLYISLIWRIVIGITFFVAPLGIILPMINDITQTFENRTWMKILFGIISVLVTWPISFRCFYENPFAILVEKGQGIIAFLIYFSGSLIDGGEESFTNCAINYPQTAFIRVAPVSAESSKFQMDDTNIKVYF